MRNGKKFTWGFLPTLLVLMSMLLVACGGGSTTTPTTPSKAPASQQVLNMPFWNGTSDIKTFDPALSTDTNSIAAINNVFTGLVQLDDNLKIQPQLASSYDLASDGLTWTFHLRPNLKFSDGTPLTSADVVYSINRALLPATKSVVGPTYLGLIKDSDKLNAGKIPTIIGDSLLTPDPNIYPRHEYRLCAEPQLLWNSPPVDEGDLPVLQRYVHELQSVPGGPDRL